MHYRKQKEREEVERLNAMTPEEREAAFKNNPRKVTNEKAKGKYKFLQKYYHRGAFFMVSRVVSDADDVITSFCRKKMRTYTRATLLNQLLMIISIKRSFLK